MGSAKAVHPDRAPAGRPRAGVFLSLPLSRLADGLEGLASDRPIVVYCSSGYRSAIAASLMRRDHLRDVSDLVGGIGAWDSARPDAVHA